MANVLWLSVGQTAALAGVTAKDVRRKMRATPGQIAPVLVPFHVDGVTGDAFDSLNVAQCFPDAAQAIIAALTPKE